MSTTQEMGEKQVLEGAMTPDIAWNMVDTGDACTEARLGRSGIHALLKTRGSLLPPGFLFWCLRERSKYACKRDLFDAKGVLQGSSIGAPILYYVLRHKARISEQLYSADEHVMYLSSQTSMAS